MASINLNLAHNITYIHVLGFHHQYTIATPQLINEIV